MKMSPDTLEAVGFNELLVVVTVNTFFTTEQADSGSDRLEERVQHDPNVSDVKCSNTNFPARFAYLSRPKPNP